MNEQGFQRPESTVSASTTSLAEKGPAKAKSILITDQGKGLVAICEKTDGTTTPYPVDSAEAVGQLVAAEFPGKFAAKEAPAVPSAPPAAPASPAPAGRPMNTSVYPVR